MTDNVRDQLTEIFHIRFEQRLPTLIASNEPPMWELLDNRVASRFAACGLTVECSGPDLRQRGVAKREHHGPGG